MLGTGACGGAVGSAGRSQEAAAGLWCMACQGGLPFAAASPCVSHPTAPPLYTTTHPPQVRIVRIFNTYGPRMALDDGRVVSNFVSQVGAAMACLLGRPVGMASWDGSGLWLQAGWNAPQLVMHHCHCPPPQTAQALKNEQLTMFGDGKQTRSFQYVSDLIEGELSCIRSTTGDGRVCANKQ